MGPYSAFARTAVCALTLGMSIVGAIACRATDRAESKPSAVSSSKTSCDVRLATAPASDAQSAFRKYADAVNAMNWCAAIGAFSPAERLDLVLVTFKGFALMAGSQNAQQAEYAREFQSFCDEHGLGYAAPPQLAALSARLMNRENVDDQLDALKQLARATPEPIYADIMTRLQRVDPNAITKLEPILSNVQVAGGRATGVAQQSDGRSSKVSFVNVANEWFVSVN